MAAKSSVSPSVNRSRPPNFSEMEAEAFEHLTCALVDKEPEVKRADRYAGAGRQKQFGIDIYADVDDGLIVASCKCYAKVAKGHMAEWSADFLDHWPTHWRDRKVRRFILVVAAPMTSRERMADIETEKARFEKIGLAYEVWSPPQLQEKLRPHRGIVSQFLGPYFEEHICGKASLVATVAPDAGAGSAYSSEQLADLRAAFSGAIEEKLNAAQVDLERGRVGAVEVAVASIRDGAEWKNIGAPVQARVVRLQASLSLERGDIDGAAKLSDEADALSPPQEPRLHALLALHRDGPEAALKVLGAPTSNAGRKLLVALNLNLGRLDEARKEVSSLPSDDIEFHRLSALLHLFRGKPQDALAHVTAAETIDGARLGIVRAGAMVRYALSLSPRVDADYMTQPQPVGLAFVRVDDESVRRLEVAEAAFARLSEMDADPSSKAMDGVWRLGCLCNLTARRSDAETLCANLLADNPLNIAAVAWGVSRNLTFDRERSARALRTALKDKTINADGVRALDWLADEAETASLLSTIEQASKAHTWQADVAREMDEIVARRRNAVPADPEDMLSAGMHVLAAARETGDWAPVEELFEKVASSATFEPATLLLAEELAGADRWQIIYDRRDAILAFETASAVQLAAFAAINVGDAQEALDILNARVAAFQGGRLPYDLRRLEAKALSIVGETASAVAKAAALAVESQSPADKLFEASLRLVIGDVGGAAPSIRQAFATDEFDPRQALSWADRIAAAEPELAQTLWRRAVTRPLDDLTSAAAMTLAFRLGVEHERPDLLHAFHRLAQQDQGAVRLVGIEEVIEEVKKGRERSENLNRAWTTGASPIHVVAPALSADLSWVFQLARGPQETPRAIFIRNGARPRGLVFDRPIEKWRLRMDITALLVADELGLLDTIEQLHRPVIVASNLPQVLLSIEQAAQFHQPSRVASAQLVLDAARTMRLREADQVSGAVSVTHEPNPEGGLSANLAAVLEALVQAGGAAPDLAAKVRARSSFAGSVGAIANSGEAMVFRENTIEEIADAGLLDELTRRFEVFADGDSLTQCRQLVASSDTGAARAERVARLRGRVTHGIEDGRYRLAPVRRRDEDDDDHHELQEALFSLLHGASADELVWIDDRYVSGYPRANDAIVVGVVEILDALRKDKHLDHAGYYERLRRLREAGALFISIGPEEIRHHLDSAPIVNGQVVETPGLAALRKSFALAMLNEGSLKVGDGDPQLVGRPNEIPFILESRKVGQIAILDQWQDTPDLGDAAARATWIWGGLRADRARVNAGDGAEASGSYAAMNIAGLAAGALQLLDHDGEERHGRRRAFMAWLDDTVIAGRFVRDEELATESARMTRDFLASAVDSVAVDGRAARELMKQIVRINVILMPESLRQGVLAEEMFRRKIAFRGEPSITLRGVEISRRRFWRAARNAIRHKRGKFRTVAKKKVRVTLPMGDRRALRFRGVLKGLLHEPALVALEKPNDEARLELQGLFKACDVPTEAREGLGAELERLRSAEARMEFVHDIRGKAVVTYLETIEEKVRGGGPIDVGIFNPPALRSWLHYLRWPAGEGEGDKALAMAVEALAADRNMDVAFDRLSGLPLNLPQNVYDAPPPADRIEQASPLQALHILRAHAMAPGADADEIGKLVDRVLLVHGSLALMFIALLRWTAKALQAQEGWDELATPARHAIVWTCADHLARTFRAAHASPAFTARFFSNAESSLPLARSLVLDLGYDDSPLAATAVRHDALLVFGLLAVVPEGLRAGVFTADRQAAILEAFGMDAGADGRILPPTRPIKDRALPTWFDAPDWRAGVLLGVTDSRDLIERCLQALEANPQDRDGWVTLVGFAVPDIGADTATRISKLIEVVDLPALAAVDEDLAAIRLLGEAAARFSGPAIASRVLDRLALLAEQKRGAGVRIPGRNDGAQSQEEKWLLSLLEAAAAASKRFEPGAGEQAVCDFAERLMSIWPASVPIVREVFDALVATTPTKHSARLWRPVLVSRLF